MAGPILDTSLATTGSGVDRSMATVLTAPGTPASADAEAPGDTSVDHLIDSYRQPAFNLAYRLVRRPEDAADAVQDAFVLAMRATRGTRAAPREPGRFGSWLLKIVANVALAQLRRRRTTASVSLDALGSDLPDGHADQPLTMVVQREQRGDVLQALLALPDAQRAALTLREYQGLTYDEIGQMLGMERGAITALLYRARAGFRAAYEGVTDRPKSVGCTELAPLISAMLDAELEAEPWRRVDRHVTVCQRCRRELRQLRRGQRLHSIIPILAPPASWTTASALGAVGASGAAGIVGVATKAHAVTGLIGRAAELTRPLVTGSLLGAAVALPSGSAGGLTSIVDRGLGKLAGLATAAGLVLALTTGSPSHHRTEEPASLSAPAGTDQPASTAPAVSPERLANPEPAPQRSERQASVSGHPPAPATMPSTSLEARLVAAPAEAVAQAAPTTLEGLTSTVPDSNGSVSAGVLPSEAPGGTAENGSS